MDVPQAASIVHERLHRKEMDDRRGLTRPASHPDASPRPISTTLFHSMRSSGTNPARDAEK